MNRPFPFRPCAVARIAAFARGRGPVFNSWALQVCGELLISPESAIRHTQAASAQRLASETMLAGAAATHLRTPIRNQHFSARAPVLRESAGGKMSIAHTTNPDSGGDPACPAP